MKREKIEEMKTMKYLGTLFNAEGSCDEKIENRIGAVSKANGAIRSEVLKRRELIKKTKCYCMGVKPGQYQNGRRAGYRRQR